MSIREITRRGLLDAERQRKRVALLAESFAGGRCLVIAATEAAAERERAAVQELLDSSGLPWPPGLRIEAQGRVGHCKGAHVDFVMTDGGDL